MVGRLIRNRAAVGTIGLVLIVALMDLCTVYRTE